MTARAPELLKLMAASKRFARVILEDYNSYVDTELEGQFAAMTFSSGRRSIYITYRGTDNHVIGWKEDFNMSYLERVSRRRTAQSAIWKNRLRRSGMCPFRGDASFSEVIQKAEISRFMLRSARIRRRRNVF